MSQTTITPKENLLRVYNCSSDVQWIPLTNDVLDIVFPSPIREKSPFGTDGQDWYGCHWKWDGKCMGHAPDLHKGIFLEDLENWRDYVKFPDIDAIDWETAAKKDLENRDRENKVIRLFMEMGAFERANVMLGFENAFIAMLEEPELYKELIDAITDFKIRLLHKILPLYQPDEVLCHDDLGTAKGPMISLDTYREVLKPAHKRMGDVIRSYGARFCYHSCGNMAQFIDDLMDCGVQLVQPVQKVNNWEQVAKKHGGKLAFEIGSNVADVPGATEEEIRAEIREIMDIFGPTHGLMMCSFASNMDCASKQEYIIDEVYKYGADFYKKW